MAEESMDYLEPAVLDVKSRMRRDPAIRMSAAAVTALRATPYLLRADSAATEVAIRLTKKVSYMSDGP